MLVYVIIDDPSNRSLATLLLFYYFKDDDGDIPYTLVSCIGTVSATERFGTGYTIEFQYGTIPLKFSKLSAMTYQAIKREFLLVRSRCSTHV